MILLATTSPDLLGQFDSERFMHRSCLTVSAYEGLLEGLRDLRPNLVLLDADLPGLPRGDGLADLAHACRDSKLIVLHRFPEDEAELEYVMHAGAKGSCQIGCDADHMELAMAAVERGELWIRRRVMGKLADELARVRREQSQQSKGCHAKGRQSTALTPREQEIALLVCAGHSNKQIGRLLNITERTVKAHMSEIFRKMDIRDRLTLTLRFAGPLEPAPAWPQVEAPCH